MSKPATPLTRRSIRRHLFFGVCLVSLLAGGVGGWAATTELSGAVIAVGQLVVDSNVKKVQHPTGGIVGELLVRNGDRVRSGEVIIRLDDTLTSASLTIVVKGLDELAVRQARLEAERDALGEIVFPDLVLARADNPYLSRIMQGEQRLMTLRREAREGQQSQLRERVAQLGEEIAGLEAQAAAKAREIELIGSELVGIRELWEKKLVPFARLTELERQAARLEGERGQLVASVAQARGRISETELQIIQIDQELRSEVGKELREIEAKTAELEERRVTAEDQLSRIEIRAPQDGYVHQLSVHTIGGVVAPGEAILLVVPDADELTVEAQVAPQDIDQLQIGQEAALRLSAFNQQTTPELFGEVSRISADLVQEERTGASFYTVRITLSEEEVARLGGLALLPGMPVETYIRTADRTVLSYLLKPLSDQINRAFREG